MENIIEQINNLEIEIIKLEKLITEDKSGFTNPENFIQLSRKKVVLEELKKQLGEAL